MFEVLVLTTHMKHNYRKEISAGMCLRGDQLTQLMDCPDCDICSSCVMNDLY